MVLTKRENDEIGAIMRSVTKDMWRLIGISTS